MLMLIRLYPIMNNIFTLSKFDFEKYIPEFSLWLALGESVKSVCLVAERLGLYSRSGHAKNYKNSIRSFSARRSAQAESAKG